MLLTFRTFDSLFDRFEKSLTDFGRFPKEDDPAYKYMQEKIESDSSVSIKETWTSDRSTFTRITSTPRVKELNEVELRNQIKLAVESEDYETAAKLKKKLEKKGA